ncbi:MAG: thioredoxin family protein [Flavobacteriales bacterium]|jgi:thioredoxin 1|nr:thioredoxin family protein [Flavobacteriales bacterium]
MNYIKDQQHLENLLKEERAIVLYFSDGTCSVGEAVAPKLDVLLKEKYPQFKLYSLMQTVHQELFAKHQIFVVPSLLVFLDGKETIRKSRNFSLLELESEIARYQTLMFD